MLLTSRACFFNKKEKKKIFKTGMLRSILYLIKLSLFWLLFFSMYRLAFLLIYPGKIPAGKSSEALYVFLNSIRLDLSTIAYLICIPAMLWAIQQFNKNNVFNHINHFYNVILISAVSMVCISNIAMYGEWNALINFNTLYYLIAPAKMFPFLTTFELIAVVTGFTAVIAVFVLLFRVMILMVIPYSTSKMSYKAIVVPLVFPILFLFMRGGIQRSPINETSARFSETMFIDHVSINPVWHLGHTAMLGMEEDKQISNTK
jgi:hypothetical protein